MNQAKIDIPTPTPAPDHKDLSFGDFIASFGIIEIAVGTLIGYLTKDLLQRFIDPFLKPIENFIGNRTIRYGLLEIPMGPIIASLINVIAVLFIIYLILRHILFPMARRQIQDKIKSQSVNQKDLSNAHKHQ